MGAATELGEWLGRIVPAWDALDDVESVARLIAADERARAMTLQIDSPEALAQRLARLPRLFVPRAMRPQLDQVKTLLEDERKRGWLRELLLRLRPSGDPA